jgi:DNA-binding NtrC family response regulator
VDTDEFSTSTRRVIAPTLGDGQTSIVIYVDDKVQVVPLALGEPVVVGRSAPASLVVPERNLSRQHARFTALEEGVRVEDLGSTNGTHYKGKRIEQVLLGNGESVTLGRVTVSISRAEARANLLGDFVGYYELLERLRDEVLRARTFRRGVAVLCVRAIAPDALVSSWAPAVRELLRPVDRMALHGTQTAFAIVPETDEDRALGIATRITELDPRLVVGVALHQPSAEELIDQARSLARAAHAGARVRIGGHDALAGATTPIFASLPMIQLEELIERVAHSRAPVLVTGETGAGKDVVAQAIHQRGPRAERPMLAVSCAAMPAALVEDILFGHEKGAFEGATEAQAGLFERADGGTLFLDEVGELSKEAQAALLRVLETQRLHRLGGTHEIQVDVRVLAATHRDLKAMVEAGSFRQDLLFRLNPIAIHVPPLRERSGDLDPMIERFVHEASLASGARVRGIEDDARAALHAYAWPGNVRELKNAIEQAVVACTVDRIRLGDLPKNIGARVDASEGSRPESDVDLRAKVRSYEQTLITEALERVKGDKAAAAKLLGMSVTTLVRKLRT